MPPQTAARMQAAIPACAGMTIKSESFREKWKDC
jgi:hypothetical protein